jgi:DNA-3-methyladenine glycosylase I
VSALVTRYPDGITRCSWPGNDQLYIDYHDTEWGVKVEGESEHFERLVLEGFQAGLSWITILKRREGFRKAFLNFDIPKVANLSGSRIESLMLDTTIIRNRAKINATIANAKIVLKMNQPLSTLLWSFAPEQSSSPDMDFELRARSEESIALSGALRKLGFSFVGPTTMYALMQSIGMVNDHAPGCFRRSQLQR